MQLKSRQTFALFFSIAALVSGCDDDDNTQVSYANKVTSSGTTLPYTVLRSGVANAKKPGETFEIRNGGYGSAAAAHPTQINQFYVLTDRGPNGDYSGPEGSGKLFPVPDYTPRIGLFELTETGSVKLVKEILLKDRAGKAITGLPNSSQLGGTGEIAYDINAQAIRDADGNIKTDDYGLDSEGLAALKDGSFWVSDEYGPHIVHFDANGQEIGRINPFPEDARNSFTLPKEFAKRRANRGMEGLTITPDQKTLVGIMQSTMYNPSSAVKALDITRIVSINLESGLISQYLYRQEKKQNANSEIVALSNTVFLVIERDENFLSTASTPPQKQVYRIDLSLGTNLEKVTLSEGMVQDDALGLTINGKTLEEVVLADGWAGLSAVGINPVSKTLVVDMVQKVLYPHDKMEGLWVIDEHTLGVLNDDDFATSSNGDGSLEAKYLDTANTIIDKNTLYIINNLDLGAQ